MSHDVMLGRQLRHFSASEVGFFEGPEKLLEVWFDLELHKPDERLRGLRMIPREEWERILDVAQCKILSSCSNDLIDAYLLSESTLLLSHHRFILKTCGNTTLLSAIPPLMCLVEKYYPGSQIMNLYYSHRSFVQPLLQPMPHSNFDSEVSYLDEIFSGGVSKSFGKGDDVWYLYGLEREKLGVQDQTLEILMNDLDPNFMAQFSTVAFSSSEELIDSIGIGELMPGATIDAKIFDPCGFSLNAIDKDVYYTIHVTPQIECSWVSFETNLEMKRSVPLIGKVLSVFQPGKAAVSIMTNEDVTSYDAKSVIAKSKDYSQINYETSSMSAYHVIYVELHSNGEDYSSSEFVNDNCLAKAMTWTKALSRQAHVWFSKKIFF